MILSELTKVINNSKKGILYRQGAANRFSEKITDFNQKRDLLIRELDKLKNSLYKIDELNNSKDDYISEVAFEKENRLKPVEWFLQQKGTNKCPFCDSESTKAIDELLSLNEEKNKNKIILENSKSFLFNFDKERINIKTEINEKEKLIETIDNNLKIISEAKEEDKSFQKSFEFIGKVQHAIDNLKKIAPSGILANEIKELQEEIDKKTKKLKGLNSKFDKELSLNKLTKLIGKYIKVLPIEDKKTKKVLLDPKESLNIKVEDTKTQNKYFLSRLGSGANYMGYHISTMLGLHEFFYKLKETNKHNFIPSFLILDQLSQVYYPEKFEEKDGVKGSKDIKDTKKIFEACNEFMKNTNNEIQLIILEHVPKSTWSNINNDIFNIVGEWRGEENEGNFKALIPKEWL